MEKLKRNKQIAKDFQESGSFSDIARKYGLSYSTAREIIYRKLKPEEIKEVQEWKREITREAAKERKRMLTEEQREKKKAYMREYNKKYYQRKKFDRNKSNDIQ
jgi:pantothenate kinase-related protein Tda10